MSEAAREDHEPKVSDLLGELGAPPEEYRTSRPSGGGKTDLMTLSRSDKIAKANDLLMRGVSVSAVAAGFGVDERTIYRWKQQYAEDFRDHFEQVPASAMLCESIQRYQHYESIAMYEVDQLEADAVEIDEATGAVKRVRKETARSPRVKYLNTAIKCRDRQVELLLNTGILPKQPERIQHTMRGESPEDAEEHAREMRTAKAIREDLYRLVAGSRTL